MNARAFSLAAALMFAAAGGAMAQNAGPDANGDVVGQWLHDSKGQTIGSVRRLADGGQTAVIMIGNYRTPGSHEARVPLSDLSLSDGKVVLQAETLQALNTHSRH